MDNLEQRKSTAELWFQALQRRIIASFEALEADCQGPFGEETAPGIFELTPWTRTNHDGAKGGGGTMAMLHGR